MLSFIEEHRPELARRHYIRKATAKNYWYDFSEGPLRRYRRKFGENFCLVILYWFSENRKFTFEGVARVEGLRRSPIRL